MPLPRAPEPAAKPTMQPLDYTPAVSAPINAPAEAAFLYRWSEEHWEVIAPDGEPVLVPVLAKLILKPGVNGVHSVGATRGATGARWSRDEVQADAIAASAAKGFRHLGPDVQVEAAYCPPGVKPGGLYRETAVLFGTRHHDAFETFAQRLGQPARVEYHRQHFQRWMAHLARAGAFGAPPAHVLAELRTVLEAERLRRRALNLPPDLRDERVAEVDRRLTALDKAAGVARA